MRTCTKCKAAKGLSDFYQTFHKRLGRVIHMSVCKPCHSKQMTDAHRLKAYGLTRGDYDAALREQGGRCAICKNTDPGNKWGFAVDHDHESGAVRALLCRGCNTGIGNMLDNPTILRAAADYLEEHGR